MNKQYYFLSVDRYFFDFGECSANNGFTQIDTASDAWYYGNWLNPTELVFISYCEGDVTKIKFDSPSECADYIREMSEFCEKCHGKPARIDAMMRKQLEKAVQNIGLGSMLH